MGNDSAILELLAGKTRGSVVAALLQQPEVLKKAYEDAMNAEGSAWRENEKYLDSIQGKIDLFNNAVQTLWSNTLDDSWIKGFVDLGTEIVKVIDKLGLIPSLLIAIGSYKGINALFNTFKNSGITIQSVLASINSLTVGFQKNAIAQTAVNGATIAQVATNKLFRNSLIETLATQYLSIKASKSLEASKYALKLAQMGLLSGIATVKDVQAAQAAVEAASIPVDISKLTTTELLSAAFKGLSVSIWSAVKAIGAFLFTNPIGWFVVAISAIASGVAIFNHFYKTTEELREELSDLKSELSDIQSELDAVNQKLETTQSRIDELLSKNKLSFIEEEELKQLQKTNDELQREIDLLKLKEQQKQKKASDTFVETMTKDVENESEYSSTGKRTLFDKWADAMLDGSADKMSEKEYIDSQISNYEYYLRQKEQIENDIIATGGEDTKEGKKLAKEKEKIDKQISEIETYINQKTDEWNKDAEGLDYGINPEADKWLDYIADIEDKWAIVSGGTNAKSNAIKRIFNKEEFAEASEEINDLFKQLEAGADETTIEKQIKNIISNNDDLVAKLKELGVTVDEAVASFSRLGEAEASIENSSITDSLSTITVLEDAFNSLGDAVKEFKEDGIASASTLKSLKETFGNVDGFEELYTVLATGEGNIEEAITNVANAYIAQKGMLSELSEEEQAIMIARLKSLGVINAEEVLQVRQKAQEELNALGEQYSIDLSNYATAEEAKLAIAQQLGLDVASIQDDQIETLAKKYGIDLDNYATIAEQKIAIAKEVARETAATNRATALSNLDREYGDNSAFVGSPEYDRKKQQIEDDYNAAIAAIPSDEISNQIKSIVENAYSSLKFDFSDNKIGIGRDFADTIKDKSSSDAESAFEKLKKQYENKIALLEAQQTYLQNEIDRMEAEGEQVGKAIYEEQIRLENEKLKLYEQERAALLEQMKTVAKGSDEWYEHANAVWETEHAIQKSTLAIVEYKQAITSLYVEAFSKIEEAFTNLNKLYEYRQNYIRNNIENIELTGGNVSADSYKNLIDIQKESVASYENQIKSLQDTLNQGLADGSIKEGSKEWIDLQFRVYDATLSMQEARNEIENINEELKELYLTAFDKVKEAFDALDDLHSDRQSYVENYMHYMELIGEPIPTSGYEYLIEEENKKLADNMQELYVLREKLADAVNNGNIEVGSEQWIELESNIRDTEAAILDNKIAIEEYNQELKNLYVEAFDKVKDAFGNETNLYDDQQAFIESYIDYLDVIGVKVPTEMYDKLIAIEKQKQQANMQQLEDLRASLANMEANGIGPNDEEWVQAQADIRAVEAAIWDSEKAMAQFNKTIQEMETEKFEEFIKRIGDVVDELENVYDILSDEDVATEDGAWTAEGITSLGLMVQKMEIAQKQIQEYQKEIDKLTDSYKAGEISEQDYNDRLVELKNSQWDAIDAYESAKDAIVDINEARIDMIEEGINKEIEAYEELIDLKKKELDSERDLFEFRKNIKNQTKDIASLERRIAAMSGSTDAATIAERTKLEAQLREAQENLDDTYYSHAMDSQSSAFDDEQEAYVTSKEDYVEMLREALKDVEQVVTDTMTQVLINADTVLGELNGVSSEYGITLSDSLTTPWINAAAQAEAFKNSAIAQQYEFIMQNGIFTGTINGQLDEMFGAGSLAATNFQNGVNANIEAIRLKVETSTSEMTSNLQIPFETALGYAQNTFSPRVQAELQAVADKAKELAPDEETDLITPFKKGTESANTFSDEAEEAIENVAETAAEYNPTLTEDLTTPPKAGENAWDLFGQKVSDVLSGMVADANTAASSISSSMDAAIAKAKSAVDAIAKAGSSGGSTLNPSLNPSEPTLEPTPQEPVTIEKKKTKYHKYLKVGSSYYYECGSDASGKSYSGYYLKRSSKIPYSAKLTAAANEVLYYKGNAAGTKMLAFSAFKHPIIYAGGRGYVEEYAKGTLGIKKDQWAIDSEPQFGDELVLVPNKGVLSYMRKGTSVIPSDLTENLIEWGKLNPDMTTLSNGVQNTNLMTNVINKPETNFEFDSLLHIDNCSNEAIPEVRKIVEEQLNKFARNLNYNLKRVGSN